MNAWLKYRVVAGILFFVLMNEVKATHIVGGELTAEYLRTVNNEWEYKVSFWIYRDCSNPNNFGFDQTLYITVFDSNNNVYRLDSIFFNQNNRTKLDVVVDNPCLIAPPNICTELGYYERTFRYPINTNGYRLTFERCCRNAGIVNIVNPGSVGSVYTTTIPGTKLIGSNPNSSPKFKNYPPLVLCIDDSLSFDHSALDKDGDSLVYELCWPYHGGGNGNFPPGHPNGPYPIPANQPPYSNVPWSTGYSVNNQLRANPAFGIDRNTGRLFGTPNAAGLYVVGICVSEYRNGVLLSENKRDFQFTVTQCDPNSIAAASSQEAFCDGLKVQFKNTSTNAISYFWDFGDPNTQSDTSSLKEPIYTYTDTGKFLIMLIANPGYSCADTVYTTYEVYDLLQPSFDRPPGQCFNKHNFSLVAGGSFQPYANFEWVFGPFGVASGSFQQNPQGVKFTQPGEFPVTLIVRENGCEESYTDTVFLFPDPTSKFKADERSSCAPAVVKFNNESDAWTEMFYYWEFGDGSTSTERSPEHIFREPGIYDVKLTTRTNEICSTAVVNMKYNYVKVNDYPVAEIEVDRTVTSIADPGITFTNTSEDTRTCLLDLGDGLQSVTCDYTHYYRNSGKYKVMQVVSSQFGCMDTNYLDITINPQVSLFIPNAFTPNADTKNEVFRPVGETPKEFEFWIYNRWGKIVYHTTYFGNGWDGYSEGEESPNDFYIYHIIMTDAVDVEHEFKGTFTLLR